MMSLFKGDGQHNETMQSWSNYIDSSKHRTQTGWEGVYQQGRGTQKGWNKSQMLF